MKKILLWILLLLSLVFVIFSAAAQEGGIENLQQTSKAFASVARSVSPSVVFVQVEAKRLKSSYHEFSSPFEDSWPFDDDLFEHFFGERFRGQPQIPHGEQKTFGQGSGFIFAVKSNLFNDRSYIITNNHVVKNAENITVTLQDGRKFDATISGTDPQSDIAVLEIKIGKLAAVTLGDSSALEVGEWVVAIGNPFGLSHTLTVGVVSAKGRTSLGISDYEDFIQTDAAINPGNSGGPLVNLQGEVVGINSAIFSKSGGYMGIGFAIPINLAKNIAEQLMTKGEVIRGHLGIVVQNLTPELAQSFGIDQNDGILIAQVMEKSPAALAGLQQGDVIVIYDGKPAKNISSFRNQISQSLPQSKKELTIIRDGNRKNILVVIGKLADEKVAEQTPTQSTEELGLTVQTITPYLSEKYDINIDKGVVVTNIKRGSVAAIAGIEPGTVILQVDKKPIHNTEMFKRAIKQSSKNKQVLLLLQKDNRQRYLVLSWP